MSPPTVSVAHDRILVTFSDDSNLYTSVFDGTSWTSADTTFNVGDDIQINPVVWPVPDGWRMLLPFDVDDAGELRLYGSLDVVGTTWSQIAVLQAATLGEGWSKASPVRGGGPMVAIVQQDPISYANTSATAVDLVGLFAVFDEWTQLTGGGGGQAGAATYTEAEVDALIADFSGELLMEDGATNPPVPIENEDQDDWLYEG